MIISYHIPYDFGYSYIYYRSTEITHNIMGVPIISIHIPPCKIDTVYVSSRAPLTLDPTQKHLPLPQKKSTSPSNVTTSTCGDGHVLPVSAKGCLQHLAPRNQVAAVPCLVAA